MHAFSLFRIYDINEKGGSKDYLALSFCEVNRILKI
jgi:hypothetical protein